MTEPRDELLLGKLKKPQVFLLIAAGGLFILAGVSGWFLDSRALEYVREGDLQVEKNNWLEGFKLLGNTWVQLWLVMLWAWIMQKPRAFFITAAALILVTLAVWPLKIVTSRPRPRESQTVMAQENAAMELDRNKSFPSGDTATAFAVAAAVVPFLHPVAGGVLFILAGGIAALRVFSLAHYPSDVLAGAALGLLAGLLAPRAIRMLNWDWKELREKKWKFIALPVLIVLPVLTGLFEKKNYIFDFLQTYWFVVLLAVAGCLAARMRKKKEYNVNRDL